MKQRLLNFDIAKALCIILVVIGHYEPDGAPLLYEMIHDIIYSFHMPLFMFASGYIYIAFKKEKEPNSQFLWKKVKRLMVPYFTVSAIVITIKLLTQGNAYVQNPVTVVSYIKALYSPEAGYFLWFIWALWWMFVIVPFFKTKRCRLALFAVSILVHFSPYSLPQEYFCFQQFQSMLMYFMIGVFCCDYQKYVPKKAHWCIGLIVFLALTFFSKYSSVDVNSKILSSLIAGSGIVMVMQLSTKIANTQKGNITRYITDYLVPVSASSYIIYLFHTTL